MITLNLLNAGASWVRLGMLMCAVSFISGCATSGEHLSIGDGDQLLREAQQALRSGAKVRAQKLFEDATKSNPADKKPWLNLAQMYFDEGNYAQAITAGQEVLARDVRDQVARSIVLVSSLRVASKSLAEMRDFNQWTGDARVEAKKLASILRENLKEEVLVPDVNTSAQSQEKKSAADRQVTKEKVKPKPKPKAVSATSPSTEIEVSNQRNSPARVPSTTPAAGVRSDPFGSLR